MKTSAKKIIHVHEHDRSMKIHHGYYKKNCILVSIIHIVVTEPQIIDNTKFSILESIRMTSRSHCIPNTYYFSMKALVPFQNKAMPRHSQNLAHYFFDLWEHILLHLILNSLYRSSIEGVIAYCNYDINASENHNKCQRSKQEIVI